jgi:membrane-associated phospholipid phosphatase
MQNIVSVTKYFVSEKRPDSNAHNSFPSGHSATAFVGAEMVRKEYGNAWGAGAYVVAGGIGFLRMYNDRHWLNDVLAGAGIGILAANAGYWILPAERKLFHWDQKTEMSVFPVYDFDNHSFSLAFTAMF